MSNLHRLYDGPFHRTSLRAKDLAPGECMGCGARSHTAFCDACAPPVDGRKAGPADRRRNGFLRYAQEDGVPQEDLLTVRLRVSFQD